MGAALSSPSAVRAVDGARFGWERFAARVRVAPTTARSHRNEGDESVEMWAISRKLGRGDSTKLDDCWEFES